MNFKAIIQARMTSSRLPGKVLMQACGKPFLEHQIQRLRKASLLDDVIVATTSNIQDEPIVQLCERLNVPYYCGDEYDVLKRVLDCANRNNVDVIVEITGDCPLIDPGLVDKLIQTYKNSTFDYVSNVVNRTFPRGLDTQIFSTKVLRKVDTLTQHPMDREHVSIYIYNHPDIFSIHGIEAKKNEAHPEYRWTLDTKEDFEFIKILFEKVYPIKTDFTYLDVYELLANEPALLAINSHIPQKSAKYYE
ncbi:MAG: glycosyltransferase family protein [Fibrobacteria bacterium]|nr:glycosyltransferase family protein [Fibrobacteria bacterium]